MLDDRERAFNAGIKEGKETGSTSDIFDVFPVPDFDGSIGEYNRGREIGAAIKNSEEK